LLVIFVIKSMPGTIQRSKLVSLFAVTLTGCCILAWAQAPAPPAAAAASQPPASSPPKRGFVPGQKRATEDPAVVARGKTLFEINCRSCHGPDLRGGDMGGPNLLRSPAALSDQHGEAIVPIIQGSRQKNGMPAINISPTDAQAVAAYVRTVIGGIQVQGMPPDSGRKDPDILVGDAHRGQVYFDSKCSPCHSATNDLKGIATRIPDQKRLQSTWVAGGRENDEPTPARTPKAKVTLSTGQTLEGQVVRLDEFLITLRFDDGSEQSIPRSSSSNPAIVVQDPMAKHREFLSEYTDSDIHNVTAYLATLK
jgi:cytochrome c oxidase cbb3-type subunit III